MNKKQPFTLYILAFSELWDRFSYYGVLSMLVLYLTKAFKFPDADAYGMYGVFSALAFAVPVMGGFLGDRLVGLRYAVGFGAILIILGNSLLAVDGKLFYFSLSLFITGVGFFKPNNASLVGAFYGSNEQVRRDTGFLIFYIGMNMGALLGPITYAYAIDHFGWRAGFLISAVGMSVSSLLFFLRFSYFKVPNHITLRKSSSGWWIKGLMIVGTLAMVGVFSVFLKYTQFFGHLLAVVAVLTVIGLFILGTKLDPADKKRLSGLSVLIFFCIFYFACALQTGTSLTLFIEREVNRHVFGFEVPTMTFMSLQPLFIIMSAPLLSLVWKYLGKKNCTPSPMVKLGIGILLASISFAIFSDAAQISKQSNLPLFLIVLGNLVLGVGELCILPVVMSSITQFAPRNLCGTMMGILFLALAFSGYLSAVIAKLISTESMVEGVAVSLVNYSKAFNQLSWMSLLVCVIVFSLNRWLKKKLS